MRSRSKSRIGTRLFFLLAATLLCGALLAGCGSGSGEPSGGGGGADRPAENEGARTEEAPPEPPPAEPDGEGREPATVRLSGSPGTVFAGTYGNLDNSEYAEGVLEGEPLEYEVPVRDSGFDVVDVSFVMPRPESGSLSVEILVDGEVVSQMDTDAQYGALRLSWSFGG